MLNSGVPEPGIGSGCNEDHSGYLPDQAGRGVLPRFGSG
jgi:hypothetical protein